MDSEQMRKTSRAIFDHIGIKQLQSLIIDTDKELGLVSDPGQAGIQIEGYWIEQQQRAYSLYPVIGWTEYGQDFSEPDMTDLLAESEDFEPLVFEVARRTLEEWIDNKARDWFEPEEF